MAGHSKWANIKHQKGAADAKRSKIFTKLIREITVAAKLGGPDLGGNPRLRLAVDKAKSQSMQKDSIERAIKKGSGTDNQDNYEEVTYEAYGPGGVALIIECLTDNRVRTVAEMRALLSRRGGNLGESGSVAWMFERQGQILLPAGQIDEDKLMELALDAGATDVTREDEGDVITTDVSGFLSVKEKLESNGLKFSEAKIIMNPKTPIAITDKDLAEKLTNLIDALEDNDDVQNVWSNDEIAEDPIP